MTEADVVKQVREYLTASGLLFVRFHPMRMTPGGRKIPTTDKGAPDFLAWTRGGIGIAIECKGPGGSLSKEQSEWLARARQSELVTMVVESAEQLADLLRRNGCVG